MRAGGLYLTSLVNLEVLSNRPFTMLLPSHLKPRINMSAIEIMKTQR